MKVYTFYSPILPDQEPLIELWESSWRKQGWKPKVLTEADCGSSLEMLKRKFAHLPSSNPQNYDLCCFLRWACLARVGGGVMVDYDVINYGFTPADSEPYVDSFPVVVGDGHVPCLVMGCAAAFAKTCGLFMGAEPRKTHTSDMLILAETGPGAFFKSEKLVHEYLTGDWATSDLVHYPAHSTPPPKYKTITNVRPF